MDLWYKFNLILILLISYKTVVIRICDKVGLTMYNVAITIYNVAVTPPSWHMRYDNPGVTGRIWASCSEYFRIEIFNQVTGLKILGVRSRCCREGSIW
jgi:hypothetical protein